MSSTGRRLRQSAGAWVGRAIRVSLGVVAVGAALGVVAVRVSYAHAAEVGLDFGEQLRELGEQRVSGELPRDVYELSMNGQPFDTLTVPTKRSMKEVLDYVQDECTSDAVGLGEGLAHMSKTLDALPRQSGIPGYLVLRKEAEDKSFVFCMAPDHDLSVKEKLGRLRRVSEDGDLGRLGDVRYVAVMKDHGGSTVTSVWTHGTFNVNTMFPKVGDSPGEDLGGVPRPEGGRRILTGHIVGAPFGVNVFEVAGVPSTTMGAIDGKLLAAGWKADTMPDEVKTKSRFYSLGSSMDLVVTARQGQGAVTDVSYMVSRAIGTVSR